MTSVCPRVSCVCGAGISQFQLHPAIFPIASVEYHKAHLRQLTPHNLALAG